MRTIFCSVLAFCFFTLSACGGGTSGGGGGGTTVTATLKDVGGNTVTATAGTTADPDSFTVTFDQAMDAASLTTAGNVTLVCGSLTPSITIASVSTTEYTITVEDAYKYQLLSCTLTLTANVKVAAGTAIEAQSFAFTINACAVSDDFNSDTQACWTVPTANATWTSWAALLSNGILAFDTTNSEIDYANATEGTTTTSLGKTVTIDPSAFEISIKTKSLSGFNSEGGSGPPDLLLARISLAFLGDDNLVYIGFMAENGAPSCVVSYSPSSHSTVVAAVADCSSCATAPCEVKGSATDGIITAQYSVNGGAFQTIAFDTPFPANVDFGSWTYLYLVFLDNNANNRASIDAIVVSGITASGQY